MNSARWTHFLLWLTPPRKRQIFSNFPVHKMELPYHPPADSTKARGASGVIIARVNLGAFGGGKRVNMAVTAAATASGGWGGSNPLIFFTSQWTCICSVLFFDPSLEYPFAIIAAGIFTLVPGLMWLLHIKKNLAAFAAFLFVCFQAQEKGCKIRCMVGKENQIHCNANRPRPGHKTMEHISRGLSQQTMTGPTKGLNVTTNARKLSRKNMKIENLCLTLATPHLG
jgi:hypothetical protein